MQKTLDKEEAAYLAALEKEDPQAENWTASWRLIPGAEEAGAGAIALTHEGAFSVMKRLYARNLVDKEPGRGNATFNGYAINDAGREALAAHKAGAKS